mgnify:CR=1 FL=1
MRNWLFLHSCQLKIVSKKEAIINNADLQKELEINKFDVQEIDNLKNQFQMRKWYSVMLKVLHIL